LGPWSDQSKAITSAPAFQSQQREVRIQANSHYIKLLIASSPGYRAGSANKSFENVVKFKYLAFIVSSLRSQYYRAATQSVAPRLMV
jgi:hypothetical protein